MGVMTRPANRSRKWSRSQVTSVVTNAMCLAGSQQELGATERHPLLKKREQLSDAHLRDRRDERDRETNLHHARCVVPRLSLLVHLGNQRVPLRMLDAINVKVYVEVGPVEVPIPLFDDIEHLIHGSPPKPRKTIVVQEQLGVTPCQP